MSDILTECYILKNLSLIDLKEYNNSILNFKHKSECYKIYNDL